ncbi:MAG TPA: ribonuclease P protein component 1 [Methanoculleus sp.]|jgi:ribonuclease P protein subunit POP4|uniref:ribonuclease P protein component 1 n=1 Tax=Methanoculleus sp. TaxID=90427 RepID=UPI000A93C22B|nr:ribonuclease P protein subunit [Methanoculleus sp.]MBP7145148.1 ribonuclease P protein component 1 [Methanoculleus sp.]HNQ32875.1 ribonuclease P protein component 1 [Methanoculleus sp.]HNT07048.1 ribonuclease P protein component 1 [Methanoculleus sp.]HNV37562.1 ribonuclease P protein component 1 [Methanoculleus sp.]HOC83378.1 ribonuclease P protein component 1 [Methanoculleus sp.]
MISPQNILRHELIGLDVLVARASNPGHVGVSGRIIDETKNTLVIQTGRGEARIPKRFSVFRIRLPDGTTVDVDGSSLEMQPERRITMRIK